MNQEERESSGDGWRRGAAKEMACHDMIAVPLSLSIEREERLRSWTEKDLTAEILGVRVPERMTDEKDDQIATHESCRQVCYRIPPRKGQVWLPVCKFVTPRCKTFSCTFSLTKRSSSQQCVRTTAFGLFHGDVDHMKTQTEVAEEANAIEQFNN
jgi:hypothetical protein